MDKYTFDDSISRARVTCSYPGLDAIQTHALDGEQAVSSVFFPGCSFLNYGMPLVDETYQFLKNAGQVDGISLLCCGKILEYEPDGAAARPAYEQQFCEHLEHTSIKRIVAACPNCVYALRAFLSESEATKDIEVVPLPTLLVEMGCEIDPAQAADVVGQDARLAGAAPLFAFKDSCPDRETGEFADALRVLMGACETVEPEHNRARSVCCGSRPRAVGRNEAAYKSCVFNHDEAKAAGANALVTACMSCTFLLSTLVHELPVVHVLEMLFNKRIDWAHADQYMKLRFLFDNSIGTREFFGIAGSDSEES